MNAPPLVRTVTLNPALDVAVSLPALHVGATNRADQDAFDPGGKGVNVSRVLRRLGFDQIALGLCGGFTGAALLEKLQAENVAAAFDEVPGFTRIDIMIYERAERRPTRLYLPGPPATQSGLSAIRSRLDSAARGEIVVFGGSVPTGAPKAIYAELIDDLGKRGVRSILDTSGEALALGLKARPLLIKPNVEEASEILGCELRDDDAVLEAARALQRRGADSVVISQGEEGAIGLSPDGSAYKAIPPPIRSISTVGSGDSMVAGLTAALNSGRSFEEGLRLGTACGAATAASTGTTLCSRNEVFDLLPAVALVQLATPRSHAGKSLRI